MAGPLPPGCSPDVLRPAPSPAAPSPAAPEGAPAGGSPASASSFGPFVGAAADPGAVPDEAGLVQERLRQARDGGDEKAAALLKYHATRLAVRELIVRDDLLAAQGSPGRSPLAPLRGRENLPRPAPGADGGDAPPKSRIQSEAASLEVLDSANHVGALFPDPAPSPPPADPPVDDGKVETLERSVAGLADSVAGLADCAQALQKSSLQQDHDLLELQESLRCEIHEVSTAQPAAAAVPRTRVSFVRLTRTEPKALERFEALVCGEFDAVWEETTQDAIQLIERAADGARAGVGRAVQGLLLLLTGQSLLLHACATVAQGPWGGAPTFAPLAVLLPLAGVASALLAAGAAAVAVGEKGALAILAAKAEAVEAVDALACATAVAFALAWSALIYHEAFAAERAVCSGWWGTDTCAGPGHWDNLLRLAGLAGRQLASA